MSRMSLGAKMPQNNVTDNVTVCLVSEGRKCQVTLPYEYMYPVFRILYGR